MYYHIRIVGLVKCLKDIVKDKHKKFGEVHKNVSLELI